MLVVARATTPARADVVFCRLDIVRLTFVVMFFAVREVVFCVATRVVGRVARLCVLTRCVVVPARVVGDVFCTRDAAKPPVAKNVQKTKIIPILLMSLLIC